MVTQPDLHVIYETRGLGFELNWISFDYKKPLLKLNQI